jgi:hypothetical protein
MFMVSLLLYTLVTWLLPVDGESAKCGGYE